MEGMRALLRGSLGKSLATLSAMDRLAAAWPVACGSALAARGELMSFEQGRLTIYVKDATWLEEMRAMRQRLTGELGRIAVVELREIHFEGDRERRAAALAAAPRRPAAKPAALEGRRRRPVGSPRGPRTSPRGRG